MHPKRYSQIERALNILDKSTSVDVLKDDPYLLFIFKKTERIVAALYLVTGLMSDNEPLKNGIRLAALSLLKDTLSLREQVSRQSVELTGETYRALGELVSLVDLSHVADLVSPMNFSVLRKELSLLHEALAARGKPGSETGAGMTIDAGFFGIAKPMFAERPLSEFPDPSQTVGSFGDLEKLRPVKDNYKGHIVTDRSVLYADRAQPRSPEQRQPRGGFRDQNAAALEVKSERKQKILALVREKKITIIKDFAAVIQGCSEKTIQRLLVELVEEGVLKREGERRWSRYSLKM